MSAGMSSPEEPSPSRPPRQQDDWSLEAPAHLGRAYRASGPRPAYSRTGGAAAARGACLLVVFALIGLAAALQSGSVVGSIVLGVVALLCFALWIVTVRAEIRRTRRP